MEHPKNRKCSSTVPARDPTYQTEYLGGAKTLSFGQHHVQEFTSHNLDTMQQQLWSSLLTETLRILYLTRTSTRPSGLVKSPQNSIFFSGKLLNQPQLLERTQRGMESEITSLVVTVGNQKLQITNSFTAHLFGVFGLLTSGLLVLTFIEAFLRSLEVNNLPPLGIA